MQRESYSGGGPPAPTGLTDNKPQNVMYTAKTYGRDPMEPQGTWRDTWVSAPKHAMDTICQSR